MMITNKITTLLVTPSFPPYTSGAATYFEQLAKHVSEESEYRVIVLTTYHKNKPLFYKKDGYFVSRIIPNFVRAHFLLRVSILPLATFLAMLYLWIRNPYKVIHVHSSTMLTVGAALFSALTRIPLVYDVQDLMTARWILFWGNVKKYISTGTQVQRRLRSFNIPFKKIETITSIPPLYDSISHQKNSQNQKKVRFIFVGELNIKIKGIDILFNAFHKASRLSPDISLTIVGTGSDKKYCTDFVRKHPELSERVTIAGTLSNEKAVETIAQSDVLLLPSRTEGMPRVIIEAFSHGVPVIASRVGGIPDVVHDDENGILVEVDATEELTREIIRIAHSTELRTTLSDNAKRYADSLPTWKDLSEVFTKIYRQI